MGKNKLAKFADMASYPNVFQCSDLPTETERHPLCGHWRERYFHNGHPIVLELGCGRGEYTVGLGRLFPEKNFIGVDIKGARMWTGATEALRDGMQNVAFLRTQIEFLGRYFAHEEVDELWLTFSDPQMKKITKRLTSTFFLTRYRQFLRDGGTIHLKTASNFLYTYTRLLVEANKLPVLFQTRDLYHALDAEQDERVRNILGIQTYYERQWMERGIPIKYLAFRLPAAGILIEPNVEIELDDYRSYHRSKRSSLERAK